MTSILDGNQRTAEVLRRLIDTSADLPKLIMDSVRGSLTKF
jgi:hypothetical protein